ncbi:MAG TPA: class I SAM-dependent methyltransferase [Solirubrobacteraceae bacterium]|nr:class I SAM-dependent methyltransferase [Solirubrobacteraceae bacterium]
MTPRPPSPLDGLRARRRQFGAIHAAAAAAKAIVDRISELLEARLLAIEASRGTLGPAHRAYRDHSVPDNREIWSNWDWRARGGEEWSESPEWKQALIEDVLEPTMPEHGVIVEIGPGGGRWSELLQPRAHRLVLIDSSERPLEVCRERFAAAGNVECLRNDGTDLAAVDDRGADAVWSFDVFVHIAPVDVAAYLSEIARVLAPGGVAVIHHSGRQDERDPQHQWRAPMTAGLFASLARERGLTVERQFDSWRDGRFDVGVYGDVISVLRAPH